MQHCSSAGQAGIQQIPQPIIAKSHFSISMSYSSNPIMRTHILISPYGSTISWPPTDFPVVTLMFIMLRGMNSPPPIPGDKLSMIGMTTMLSYSAMTTQREPPDNQDKRFSTSDLSIADPATAEHCTCESVYDLS